MGTEKEKALSPAPTATIKLDHWWNHPDRGGYGSTGEKSAEEPAFLDANGEELNIGDFVTDELMDCYCVMGLNISDGDAYADIGNGNASVKVALCRDLELDQRPHDFDGVPIEVGDVLYVVDDGGSEPAHWFEPLTVVGTSENGGFAGNREPTYWRIASNYTHREPDSFEKIASDAMLNPSRYFRKVLGELVEDPSDASVIAARHDRQQADILRRMKAVAARD